jgi:hypothetical protein
MGDRTSSSKRLLNLIRYAEPALSQSFALSLLQSPGGLANFFFTSPSKKHRYLPP